ncbi:MAG: hypothetical protein LBJ63_09870 [Prevotellaceae bacterium]|nr:hypothetical protein [Prevotellaceae bacterium]
MHDSQSCIALKGRNFHNRWSSTIGRETAISYCLKGMTFVRSVCPA